MKILIATDAWHPQVNGVVRTYERLGQEIERRGGEVYMLHPSLFRTIPCPTYPEIRLALLRSSSLAKHIKSFGPDHIHIATEGPVGLATRRYCRKNGYEFTTSYHTKFPEYFAARFPVPESWGYAFLRRFHNSGHGVMVATRSLATELEQKGFKNILPWTRGVDMELFHPRSMRLFGDQAVFLYVGRVAVEKNIEAFLQLDLPGKKVVIGGGPQLEILSGRYKDCLFLGPQSGEKLAQYYASADVFVFPSLTDTFGIVLIEALASGLPVAAFPVTGPIDILEQGKTGIMDQDLKKACLAALDLKKEDCLQAAMGYSWQHSTTQFLQNIEAAKSLR